MVHMLEFQRNILPEFLGLKNEGLENGGSTFLKNNVRYSYVPMSWCHIQQDCNTNTYHCENFNFIQF